MSGVSDRATGLSWRDAAGLGVLMNTRGLMQLIVINVGDLGVIAPTLFTMMVLMMLATRWPRRRFCGSSCRRPRSR